MIKNLIKFYSIIFTIIILLSCFIYYVIAEDVYYYNKSYKIEISDSKAFEIVKNYNPNNFYYIKKEEKVKKTKTKIPFYYKKEILEIKNYELYSQQK